MAPEPTVPLNEMVDGWFSQMLFRLLILTNGAVST
jgi:hypothetical protein